MSQVITMRAEAEVKERLRAAAEVSRVSLSQFVLDAALSRADDVRSCGSSSRAARVRRSG